MYRIFCESYRNFVNSFDKDNYRLQMSRPLSLIADIEEYNKQKEINSELYQQVQALLCYMNQNIDKYPRFKAFLWTISSRGMEPDIRDLTIEEDIIEQAKLVNSFLKLAYW